MRHKFDLTIKLRDALSMYLMGYKKHEIAKHFKVHRKTVGRWFKKMATEMKVDVDSTDFQTIWMDALQEHGENLRIFKLMALKASQAGNQQEAYAYARRFESGLKRRDRAIEKFGVQFKSKLEKENDELKTLCAWALILAQRLDDNLLSVTKNGPKRMWRSIYDISADDIHEFRQCPEMFQIENYFKGAQKARCTGYMDRYDIEMMILRLCFSDPEFDVSKDDPVAFASQKVFKSHCNAAKA